MASVASPGKETARCGQQGGDEEEALAFTAAWTQGGHRQATGEPRVALELPWRLTTWKVILDGRMSQKPRAGGPCAPARPRGAPVQESPL